MSAIKQNNIEQNIMGTLIILQNSINQHKFELLKPYLAPNFSFNEHDGSMGLMIMEQIVNQYPKTIKEIKILDIKELEQLFSASVELNFQDHKEEKTIVLSSDYKIVQAEIVQIQMAGHQNTHNDKKTQTLSDRKNIPEKLTSPFTLAGRLIVVDAEVEGIQGKFLVDSGSTGFWLDINTFSSLRKNAKKASHSPHGAGGATGDVLIANASNFRWQNVRLNSISTFIYDLSYQKDLNSEIIGIIGADFLQKYTVQFDYANNVLTLFSSDETDKWDTKPDHILDFKMISHIPVIEAKIEGHVLLFGIDSGAEGAMLFSKWENPLLSQYEIMKEDTLRGIDSNVQTVKKIRVNDFKVGNVNYENHTFLIGNIQWGHESITDGLLGYEFLSQHKTAIDFPNQKIYIWGTEPK